MTDLTANDNKPGATIFIAGMGRSGTTWAADIVNHSNNYRIMFEPFHPLRVNEAKAFEYIQYMNPRERVPVFTTAARRILAGSVHNSWVDQQTQLFFSHRIIIKDIRCNLMLRWLKEVYPSMPIVLVMRHPLAVTASWLRLGWGAEAEGKRTNFDIITSQQTLLDDFPIISEIMKSIDRGDLYERIVFEWCISHLVPFQQFVQGELFLLVYENLLLKPEEEINRLFCYLNTPIDWDTLVTVLQTPSMTNYLHRDIGKGKVGLLAGWKKTLSDKQIQRANHILSMFELDDLYDEDGYPSAHMRFQE